MRSYVLSILVLVLFILFSNGCATKNETILKDKILTPESVEVYDVNINNVYTKPDNRTLLLKKFPFISNQPVFDFYGKFSDQFYDKLDYRYKSAALKDVDFWKLRTNPFVEDFIYVLPTWANKFQRVSNDLFQNIGYSYNLSSKEQEILKWWIGEGGILWIEGGIYSTRYDTFKKNGEIDSKAITKKIVSKSKNMNFFNKNVSTYIYKSTRLDHINYVPLKLKFSTGSDIEYFKDIKSLQIQTKNFLSADFLPKGKYLLFSKKNRPLVSFVPYGKGGVVFIRPFEFKNKRYDGELLRWKLVYYLLNKMYLKDNAYVKGIKRTELQEVSKKLGKTNKLVLHNLNFEYKSYKLKKDTLKRLVPIARYLKNNKNSDILISGYTDNIGSFGYNKILSKNRAESVKKALVKMGVSAKRLTTIGNSKNNPIATNKTAYGRALNRRVELTVTKR